jgi:hypothetical protein
MTANTAIAKAATVVATDRVARFWLNLWLLYVLSWRGVAGLCVAE